MIRWIRVTAYAVAVWTLGFGSGAAPARAEDDGWVALFDGKTLDGWSVQGGTARYRVEDGTIVGSTVEGSPNTFLCKGDYANFEFELDVKCDPRLNSGIQVRSHVQAADGPDPNFPARTRPKGVVYGPQCEIALNSARSAALLLRQIRPSSRNGVKAGQRVSM